MRKSTELIHTGERTTAGATPSLTTPIYASSTFIFESAAEVQAYQDGRSSGYLYSRYDNPTVVAVEKKLAAVDGAERSLLFSSGQAASTHALLTLLRQGDEVVCSAAIYGGTYHLIADWLPRFGIEGRFVSLDELARPASVIGPRTRVVWFESPINPTLRCVDVAAVAVACRQAGVVSVVDNTFACPLNQPVLSMGVDLSMQSATKYLNGHSDVTAGVLSGTRALLDPVAKARRLMGATLDPQPAYALGRGLKTLALRVARHNENALHVARALESHPSLARVYYPGLESHPDHAIARRQMTGFGGMVTIDVRGGREAAFRTFDRLQVIKRAASLGGVESICSLPVLTSHTGLDDQALARAGVSAGMIRLSIGLEDPEDLVEDLRQALAN
ncbi:MAG TPA: aminotransferase class I/II-fold pyridoxal phosphate-dependent enzyme [Vicinamibacterales bacterium]|nr:aminotransferase class I/II-fold pyridoxal phosphate-dependent enzyme [Vicinamibacterales bacterium]